MAKKLTVTTNAVPSAATIANQTPFNSKKPDKAIPKTRLITTVNVKSIIFL